MEERIPTSDDTTTTPTTLPPPPPAESRETYVVQVPRDQIYRVPPPEHALIIEEHKRISSNQDANRRSKIFSFIAAAILLSAAALVAILIVRATLYLPQTPDFAVTGIQGRNLEQKNKSDGGRKSPEFRIGIQARNQNTRLSVSYKEGGGAFLDFKDKRIGQGKLVPAAIEEDGSGSADFDLVVAANAAAMGAEMKKSLNEGKEKAMKLKMELTVEMNSWMRNQRMNVVVSCDFGVRNSFANHTKISFQECLTKS